VPIEPSFIGLCPRRYPHQRTVKISQRLDYNRLAETLFDLGAVEHETLQHILQQSFNTGEIFPEVLVREGLIADWELSRIACEAFHIVFLSVDFYEPSSEAVEMFDREVLHQHCLVPLDVFDDLVTVAMPALTPSEVLVTLSEKIGKVIQPAVGTAASNRRWLIENAPISTVGSDPAGALPSGVDEDWSSVFDEGDAAVLMELNGEIEEADAAIDLDLDEADLADESANLDDLLS